MNHRIRRSGGICKGMKSILRWNKMNHGRWRFQGYLKHQMFQRTIWTRKLKLSTKNEAIKKFCRILPITIYMNVEHFVLQKLTINFAYFSLKTKILLSKKMRLLKKFFSWNSSYSYIWALGFMWFFANAWWSQLTFCLYTFFYEQYAAPTKRTAIHGWQMVDGPCQYCRFFSVFFDFLFYVPPCINVSTLYSCWSVKYLHIRLGMWIMLYITNIKRIL